MFVGFGQTGLDVQLTTGQHQGAKAKDHAERILRQAAQIILRFCADALGETAQRDLGVQRRPPALNVLQQLQDVLLFD